MSADAERAIAEEQLRRYEASVYAWAEKEDKERLAAPYERTLREHNDYEEDDAMTDAEMMAFLTGNKMGEGIKLDV